MRIIIEKNKLRSLVFYDIENDRLFICIAERDNKQMILDWAYREISKMKI